MIPAQTDDETTPLSPVREELQIINAAADHFGRKRWVIYDPVRHKYFSIGFNTFFVLSHWQGDSVETLTAHLLECDGAPSINSIQKVLKFLQKNQLLEPSISGEELESHRRQSHRSLLSRMTHGYLFFRIPLLRPNAFLKATYPFIAPLYSWWFRAAVICMGLLGLYLTSRQWEAFKATFIQYFSLEGVVYFALALVGVKILHELGHAYTAVRYGCRVPTMGIAFMVLTPLLYTDVTDAWRLAEKRKRLRIDASGILVELTIAAIATFLWAFLPDGPVRAACFFVATVSWVLSLFVNLNPFMKFDGYHLTADGLGIENLQARSSHLGRWWLRKSLFGIEPDRPEPFGKTMRRTLIGYAYAMWIYRFFLFLGIAVLVYYLTFKALGIILFIVEILFFIGLPIWREFQVWWRHRGEILKMRRGQISLTIMVLGFALLFVPFSTKLRLPAILEPALQEQLFSPYEAKLANLYVRNGDRVEVGDLLFELNSAGLNYEVIRASAQLELSQILLNRQVSDARSRSERFVLERQLNADQEVLEGLSKRQRLLAIRANLSGVVENIPNGLSVGDYVRSNQQLAIIQNTASMEIMAYVNEEQFDRFSNVDGEFVPNNPIQPKVEARYEGRENTGIEDLDHLALASVYGGDIAVEEKRDGAKSLLKPKIGQYRARYGVPENVRSSVGTLFVKAKPQSLAQRIYQRMSYVFIRESGF